MAERLLTAAEATAANAAAAHDTQGNDVTMSYVVVAQARTGSTMLEERLRARGLGRPFEYLNPNLEKALVARWTGANRPVRFASYMTLLKQHRTTAGGYFGVKCLYTQLERRFGSTQTIRAFLVSFDRILVLHRRDKLAQAISAIRAEQTGQWTSRLAGTAAAGPVYDSFAISERIHRFLLQDRVLASMKLERDRPVLALTYEAFRDAPEQTWAQVQEFLGVPRAPAGDAQPSTRRQNDALSAEWERLYLQRLGGTPGRAGS